ncbi:MAG TPA: beta-ketoacyl-ACP synthase II [Polyangia bacterium]|jgi:3-oxoacyl-[acyl-carrier-protein] synthase II|nr:beta-ketoacyl-ACP synthase II [Polyangia bacterium]
MKRRIVVTGIGLVTPVAIGTEETWQGLVSGKSGIGPITHFDHSQFATHFAGEIRNFDPTRWMSSRDAKNLDPFIQYAVAAGALAMEDSGLKIEPSFAERVGCFVGAGLGGVTTIESTCRTLWDKGPRHGISPFFVPMIIVNLAPGQISIRHGAKGPNLSQVSACSSGAHAIGDAFRVIQRGDVDAMICGGAEATVTALGVGGFNSLRALSTRNEAPQEASRPFDKDRDGFVMAEGAGILVLEELEFAKKRGAKIYAELSGYGLNADAHHITAPAPEGEGAQRCMKLALKDAGLSPSDIGYINAHGTSTKMNDANETLAIKKVFGDHARSVMVSSTKSMTGHMLGAAGGVEAAISALTIARGVIPPTINYTTPDPDCDLDYVPNTAREVRVKHALSSSFGFGGTNACLIMSRFE